MNVWPKMAGLSFENITADCLNRHFIVKHGPTKMESEALSVGEHRLCFITIAWKWVKRRADRRSSAPSLGSKWQGWVTSREEWWLCRSTGTCCIKYEWVIHLVCWWLVFADSQQIWRNVLMYFDHLIEVVVRICHEGPCPCISLSVFEQDYAQISSWLMDGFWLNLLEKYGMKKGWTHYVWVQVLLKGQMQEFWLVFADGTKSQNKSVTQVQYLDNAEHSTNYGQLLFHPKNLVVTTLFSFWSCLFTEIFIIKAENS